LTSDVNIAILNVSVEVSWSDKGRPYSKIIEERLYNWQQQQNE